MIYKLKFIRNRKFESMCNLAWKELSKFYGTKREEKKPRLFIVEDRRTIDALCEKKTEHWVIGWSENKNIFILDPKKFESESSHKKRSTKEVAMLLKHELSHVFCTKLVGISVKPKWLSEGIAMYTSGQYLTHPQISEFKTFLKFFNKGGVGVYSESGIAIQMLVKKYGKQKLFDLMKLSSKSTTQTQFSKIFKKIYGFEPTYKQFNKLITK